MMRLSLAFLAILTHTSRCSAGESTNAELTYPSLPIQMLSSINSTTGSPNNGGDMWNIIDKPREKLVDDLSQQQSEPVPSQATTSCFIDERFKGFGYDQNEVETGSPWIPPDPSGAAGGERLVSVVNSMIEVLSKDGTLKYRDGLNAFFASLDTTQLGSRIFDPKVVYDEHAGRFVVVALQLDDSKQFARILLAVSKNERPDSISEWNKLAISSVVSINNKNHWADYPGFEVDEEAVYFTGNMFTLDGSISSSQGVRLWIVDKGVNGGFYGGGTATFSGPYNPYQSGGIIATTMPAQIHGAGGAGTSIGTFLASSVSFIDGRAILQVTTIRNPLGAVTLSRTDLDLGLITQDGGTVPNAPQRGTNVLLDTGGTRTRDAVWRNNKLWMTFTVNPRTPSIDANQATAHWVRVDTTGGVITLEAQGNLGGETFASQTSTFYPAVAINKREEVAFGYAASSPTIYGGAYGTLLLGTTTLSFTVQNGLDWYIRDFGGTRNRWGDYTGVSVDPVDDSFWIYNQFADVRGSVDSLGQAGRWGTAWARVYCTEETPTNSPMKAPTKAPIIAPMKAPTKEPIIAPLKAPTTAPINAPSPIVAPIRPPIRAPTNAPVRKPCGLFGWSIFCPLTLCGILGRLLGLCRS